MARSLEEMARVGYEKLSRKSALMTARWDRAKGKMKENYGDMPFGPDTKRSYNEGIDAATHRTDAEKWRTNWPRGVRA